MSLPLSVCAHELLPTQIIEYLNTHPEATADDIRMYAQTLDPQIAKKFTDTDAVIRMVRNQDTNIWDNALDFLVLGVKHILSGLDHVLFVLSMLLVFTSVWEPLRLTTTFTIAHSITLLIAGAGIFSLSPSIAEPFIAFSIAFLAVTTVFFKDYPLMKSGQAKIATIFFFGLFHGFGFAGLLTEVALPKEKFTSSLFAFNVEIEVGQIIIILLSLPLILYVRKKAWYVASSKIFSVSISMLALFWVVERVFLTPA